MPTYEYECKKCSHRFEVFQSMSDEPIKKCPECGKEVRRLVSGGVGVIFKGSGFYVTDKDKSSVPKGNTVSKGNSDSKGDGVSKADSASKVDGGSKDAPVSKTDGASSEGGSSKADGGSKDAVAAKADGASSGGKAKPAA